MMFPMPKRLTIVLVVAFTTALAASARADEKISPNARAHFEAGVALLQDPDGARYEEAYREFSAAFEKSKSPRVLGNLALCAMKLERDAEAIEAYTRYVEEVTEIDPVEREQIKRDLVTLKNGLVRVTIEVSPAGAKIYDVRTPVRGEPISNVYDPNGNRITIGMRAGHHVITARIGDRESTPLDLDAQPGATYERALTVAPTSASRAGGSRTLPALTFGLGLATLAAGGVTGYLSLKRVDDIAERCPNGECPGDYDLEGAQRRARTLTTATDVLLISGGVLTLTGFTWLLLSGGSSSREKEKEKEKSTQTMVGCSGTGCFATIGGTF
jgi:hypothetical protein